MLDKENMPNHVAIIMDGNGRWAKKKNVPRVLGHNAGMQAMKKIVIASKELGIKYLTVYAFSTENWKRSEDEIKGIFSLLIKYVNSELNELNDNKVKVNIIGDYNSIPESAKIKLKELMETTRENDDLIFNIALNYGGRAEIVRAANNLIAEGKDNITISDISSKLYTGELDIPDPDLLIRTSGEERISNYLLWQCAYSEFVFTDVLWPDMDKKEYERLLEIYQSRSRRFGGRC
ncbi:MAG TPA: isoprenyl transferase [Anaerovoracaceae bacterium]|nr:isoprenyl transferase [Anaerovoracaceae bacterium]